MTTPMSQRCAVGLGGSRSTAFLKLESEEQKMSIFNVYKIKIKLTSQMLGTNPIDVNVMDKHIIDRQRKLISENSGINKAINKYFMAKDIEGEEEELQALRGKIDEMLGTPLTDEEFQDLKEGKFKKLSDLRESMKELDEKGITCFFRNPANGKVCIGSHMILGFMKAAGEAISKTLPKKNGTMLYSASYTSSIINQHCSVATKFIDSSIDIDRDEDGNPVYLQRSLRAMTAQGPRVSLAKSETIPEGAEFEFDLRVMKNSPMTSEVIDTLFSYGVMTGIGQWRGSGGKGQFDVVSCEMV